MCLAFVYRGNILAIDIHKKAIKRIVFNCIFPSRIAPFYGKNTILRIRFIAALSSTRMGEKSLSQVVGNVKWILRIEGLSIFLLALYIYQSYDFGWTTFVIYFLFPDLSFSAYLANSKVGAIAYNCAHSLIGACVVLGLSVGLGNEVLQIVGLIWAAHIGFDGALGYGLKYEKGFRHTHLGVIGKEKNA